MSKVGDTLCVSVSVSSQHAVGPDAKGYDDNVGYDDGTLTRRTAGGVPSGVPGRGSSPPLRGSSSSLRPVPTRGKGGGVAQP